MSQGLRMVHLRTVPDAWHANVLAARLGAEGIVTHLQGNLSGPYPFGAVSVLVETGQAELAESLLLADEVEASFSASAPASLGRALVGNGDLEIYAEAGGDLGETAAEGLGEDYLGPDDFGPELSLGPDETGCPQRRPWSRWRRALAAIAALLVFGAPVLARFFRQ